MVSIIDRSTSSSDLNISLYFHYTYLHQVSIATGLRQALGSPTQAKDCSFYSSITYSAVLKFHPELGDYRLVHDVAS